MPSAKQIAANRRNAQKSTGPKTPEGKEKSALNAVRHGLRAEHVTLFDETPDGFRAFHEDLRTAHAPAGAAEDGLVERIAMAHWRLRRVWRAEAAAINDEALSLARRNARSIAHRAIVEALRAAPPDGKPMTEAEIADAAARALHEAGDAAIEDALAPDPEAAPLAEAAPPAEAAPQASLADAPIWPHRMVDFARYEGALERTLQRLTKELAQLQALRHARAVASAKAARDELAAQGRADEMARHIAALKAKTLPTAPDETRLRLAECDIEIAKRSQFPHLPQIPSPARAGEGGAQRGALGG